MNKITKLVLLSCVWLLPISAFAQSVALTHSQLMTFTSTPTVTAIASGNWSSGATWPGGIVPGAGAKVNIPTGIIITVDREILTAYAWVRVDGTLRFANTSELIAETVVAMGRLEMGTVAACVNAKLTIRSDGLPIDHAKDPLELSRGLIAMSPVSIYGCPRTEIVVLGTNPAVGATSLLLGADVTNWAVGDELLVAPTLYGQDQVVTITTLTGRTVGFTPALAFTRQNVPRPDLRVHVGHFARTATIRTDPTQAGNVKLQGHVMLMGGGHQIYNVAFNDLGRTSALAPVSDPLLLPDGTRDPQLMPICGLTEENVRGRYSLHFHRPGPESPLSIVEGAVIRAKRNLGLKIGIQNHSAHVAVRRVVVHQIDGSGLFTEEGDERGEYRESLVVHSLGSNTPSPETPRQSCSLNNYPSIFHKRRTDMGHRGAGIWIQGGQVDVVGNIFAGHQHAAIDVSTEGLDKDANNTFKVLFPSKFLREGDWWLPAEYKAPDGMLTVQIPPSLYTDNIMYAIGGLQTNSAKAALFLLTGLHLEAWAPRPKNIFARNLAWNVINCINTAYSSWTRLEDMTCIAGALPPGGRGPDRTTRVGIATTRQNGRYWDYVRVRIEGFTLTPEGVVTPGDEFRPSEGSTFTDVTVNGKPYVPTIEACGDSIDNDGDGLINEDCLPSSAPPPDTTAPQIVLQAATVVTARYRGTVEATDSQSGIALIEVLVDGIVIATGTASSLTYEVDLLSTAPGKLEVKVTDKAGNAATVTGTVR